MADSPAERTEFSLESVPAAKRYSVWKESINVVFDVERTDKVAPFDAHVESFHTEEAVVVRTRSVQQLFTRDSCQLSRSPLEHYLVQVFLQGETQVRLPCESRCGPGDVLVIDAAQPYTAITSEFENITFVLPRNTLSRHLRCPDAHQGRVLPKAAPLTQLIHDTLLGLYRRLPRLPRNQARDVVSPVADLIASGLRGLGRGDVESSNTVIAGAQLGRMRAHLNDNLSQPGLGVQDLCRRFRVSRSYVYKLFQPMGGVSTYIREQRLMLARRSLAAGRVVPGEIGELAARCGFSSHAQFCRLYRARFGDRPSDMIGSLDIERCPRRFVDGGLDRSYERWIRNLR